jgi:ubiquinone/menaquinone biosynthesis C-methylase UbiE
VHPKLLYFRHKLFRYRHIEQTQARAIGPGRMLDIGCGDGENLLRFKDLPLQKTGLELSLPRLRKARAHSLNVLQASGTRLPFPSDSFNFIYVAHVLHHIADYESVLAEIGRCLAPGGVLFLVETVTDNPLLRFGRKIHPFWQGDEVEVNWSYRQLSRTLTKAGFEIQQSDQYNLTFFLWEMLPLAFWPFEIFTPIFVYLDLLLSHFLKKYSAHCYFLAGHSRSQLPITTYYDRSPSHRP